jgi:hypothetical protein
MVVSKAGVILQPTTVSAHSFTIPVGSRKCTIAEGTPLAALKATGIVFHVKDYAKCSTKPSASAGLFLDRILTTSNTGSSGWTFKVNNRAGTAGSADASGPFGTGPLANGDKVVWFWCVFDANWACQRNLAISVPTAASPGSTITVTVTAVDDFGVAIPASRAKVTAGSEKMSVKFYLTAILFILFDLEIAFLFPWATIFKEIAESAAVRTFGFIEMFVFIGILVVGSVYAWAKGALDWE